MHANIFDKKVPMGNEVVEDELNKKESKYLAKLPNPPPIKTTRIFMLPIFVFSY